MKVKAIFLGFGARGQCYANYVFENRSRFEIAAVADPKKHIQELASKKYGVAPQNVFSDWKELLSKKIDADIVFIATQDNEHIEPAIAAIKSGYKSLMVEKPIDKDIEKCMLLVKAANEYGANVQVCHSLRYTNFYRKVKEIIESGALGQVINVNHLEAVGKFHYVHSFVRGDWNKDSSSPMILAKCCHDTDLLVWLLGQHCTSVSSFGSLQYFKSENAPHDAPKRCIDGCSHNNTCPYSAMKYFSKYRNHLFREYAVEKEGFTTTEDAMKHGRYGRCAFYCDNNVVDHQIVNLLFEKGTTATLTMCAFSDFGRETHVMGTMGEMRAYFDKDIIEVYDFGTNNVITYNIAHSDSLHGGADTVLVEDAISVLTGEKKSVSEIALSVESHKIAIAAEESRLTGKTIQL